MARPHHAPDSATGFRGQDLQASEANWQTPVSAPEGAPSVIVILLDDVGFGHTSTSGGLIPTPNLDHLASERLHFNHDPTRRDCFVHLIDFVPTILEAAHLPMPTSVNGIKQQPLAGKSFLASFTDPKFEGRDEQYFEEFANRSIYASGWRANAQHTLPWRQDLAPGNCENDKWELYNLEKDLSEANNLSGEMPDKIKEMKAKFDAAAQKYHVYPSADRGSGRLALAKLPVAGADITLSVDGERVA